MWSKLYHQVPESPETDLLRLEPKQPYLAALRELSQYVPNVQAMFDHFGHVRTITSENPQGLFDLSFNGDPIAHARKFLALPPISRALGLRFVELSVPTVDELPTLGWRVDFHQIVTLRGDRTTHPVRGGCVQVFVNKEGKVFQLNSTIRYGRRPASIAHIVSEQEAIEAAKLKLDGQACQSERADLVFSAHNDKMDPVYEVVLTTVDPRKVVLFLVKATSGEVVYQTNKLRPAGTGSADGAKQELTVSFPDLSAKGRNSGAGGTSAPVFGRSFLRIPDPNQPLAKQVYDIIIDSLPDPKVLKNDNLIMYVGRGQKEVKCKADGTFNYKPGDPEFAAVVTFFAINSQIELYKSWGMKAPSKPIPCYVEDPSVSDNAYFDPEAYEMHIGIGSGIPNGLNRYIAYDMGVSWHENGHHAVFLQTPGHDLPGSEGGAMHESVGDVLGDLLMDFWFRNKFGSQLAHTLTSTDVDNDRRVIGVYAAPPDGIRIQKNTKKTPKDKTGEPHDDGLISGGAKADLLVAMVLAGSNIEKSLADFGKLTLAALALVPSHKVTFRDLLNAYLTADQALNASANKQLITKAFADHGITLAKGRTGGGKGGVPVIIIIG